MNYVDTRFKISATYHDPPSKTAINLHYFFLLCFYIYNSRHSVVCVVTILRPEHWKNLSSIPGQCKNFSLLLTETRNQSTSYLMHTRVSSPRHEAAAACRWSITPSSGEGENEWSWTSLPTLTTMPCTETFKGLYTKEKVLDRDQVPTSWRNISLENSGRTLKKKFSI